MSCISSGFAHRQAHPGAGECSGCWQAELANSPLLHRQLGLGGGVCQRGLVSVCSELCVVVYAKESKMPLYYQITFMLARLWLWL